MKLQKISHYWNSFLKFADKNTPHILSTAALFGLVETAVLAFRAGPEAKHVLEWKKKRMDDIEQHSLIPDKDRKEVLKNTTKDLTAIMAPTILTGTATAACIIASDRVSAKRIATLSAAYTIADTAYKEYKNKVTELVGEKKARSIQESITKDRVQKTPPPEDNGQIPVIGNGTVLCKDTYSGRYFYSTAQKIESSILKLSGDCMTDMWISLNDLYYELGLEQVPMGSDLGWNADDLVQYHLPITITAVLTDTKQPCLGVDYDVSIRADFKNLH